MLLELKSDRLLTELTRQVNGYSALIDEHAAGFASLFGALLGEDVRFDAPTEKWIVWPAAGDGPGRQERELARSGIRVVTYSETGGAYTVRVSDRRRL